MLPGATPGERFESFLRRLRKPEAAAAILREYPVLARLVVAAIDAWVEVSLEFLERLATDHAAITRALFAGGDPGRLETLGGFAGDPHHGGRSVLIAGFASGARLVYKPRPLAVDDHFQDLLGWVNDRSEGGRFRTLSLLDRGAYGWMEHVASAPCASLEEVRGYHERLGGLLALLLAIEGTDVHFENLIAAGEEPVLIDLEALLHPRLPLPQPVRADERLLRTALGGSVLRVGLLPFRVGEAGGFEGADLSGVASVEGQPAPDEILRWEAEGTDAMHAVRERPTMRGGRNRPLLEGAEAEAGAYRAEISRGFEEIYRLLVAHRRDLLAPDGPLARFAGDEVRAVLRPTRAYGLLLDESFHPDFLRDAIDRDLFFDRLAVGAEEFPAISVVIPLEHRDLWAGDIPYFSSRPASTDLFASRGERIAGFFERPAIETARTRIEEMDEDDLRRQSWLIRLSLGTRQLSRGDQEWPGYEIVEPEGDQEDGELRGVSLDAARAVGDWLDRTAFRDEEAVTWVGLDLRKGTWSLNPISEDLYAGIPGIALFLGYLGKVAGDDRATLLSRLAIATLLRRLEHTAKEVVSIGAFQGWGGLVYAAAHLGALWDDGALLQAAEGMAGRIAALAETDVDLDVVAGAAGAIAGLLSLHEASGSGIALDVARRCGERLLKTAVPHGAGLQWLTRMGGDEPQTGFSHGAAGIGWALIDLGAATGDDRFAAAGREGFAFEREIFWPALRTWIGEDAPLIQPETTPPLERAVAVAWCYGAPGVGLARLGALRHHDDPVLLEEASKAVRITLERGFGKNHSLCHGDLGNLDFLIQASRRFDDPDLARQIRRLRRVVLSSMGREGWLCGTAGSVEAPGLMNGLAGIGYGLLRLAEPDRVPSVLILEPPPLSE